MLNLPIHLDEDTLRREAWIGDAVLSLFAREWLDRNGNAPNADALARMTSNQFLSCFGRPTLVEAAIGLTYRQQGLSEAFLLIESELLPVFQRQESNRLKQRR